MKRQKTQETVQIDEAAASAWSAAFGGGPVSTDQVQVE
jgi:hypothetical protein